MNKKLFFGLFAAAAMLLATACSNEATEEALHSDDKVQVNFMVQAPNGTLATRTIGDGTGVDALYWSVYDAAGSLLENSGSTANAFDTTLDGKPCEVVELRLVKGQAYTVVFWAQNSSTTAYTIAQLGGEYDLQNIAVDYTSVANMEARDGFFGKEIIDEVTTDKSYTVTLNRPFAQINVGVEAEEWNDAIAAGVEVEESAISLTDIPNKLNALTGVASGSVDVDYSLAAIPTTPLTVDTDNDGTDESLTHLTYAYILAHEGSNTTDATLQFKGTDGEVLEVEVDKMPYQRNYRTNIFGHVLTRGNDFTVVVDAKFADDYNILLNEEDIVGVAALEAAMAANTSTEPIIYNIEGVTSPVEITIPAGFQAEKVTFNFVDIADGATLTLTGLDFAHTALINTPESVTVAMLTINMPLAHVVLNKGNYTTVSATTANTTLVVGGGVKVDNVEVEAGSVKVMKDAEVKRVEQAAGNSSTVVVYVEQNATAPATEGNVNILEENKDGAGDNVYTLTLTENLTLAEPYTIALPMVLDGAGYTLTSSADSALNISTLGNVTIKNLTIECSEEQGINITGKNIHLDIENLTVVAANYAVNVADSALNAKVTIKNSTLTGRNVVNVAAEGAEVGVDDTTLNTVAGLDDQKYAALVLAQEAKNSTLEANNCTFNLADNSVKAQNIAMGGTLTIDGSTDEVEVIYAALDYGDHRAYYKSVEEAIEAAKELDYNKAIVVVRQVVIESDVALDLQGKMVEATDNFELFKVVAGGKLTIGNGRAKAWSAVVWNDGGEVVINDGDYEQTGSAVGSPSTYRYCLKTSSGGITTLNGGSFSSHNGLLDVGATVVINGGEFDNNMTDYVTTRHMAFVSGTGNLTINGGTFRSVANSSAGGECICIYSSNAVVTLAGGRFTSLWSGSYTANAIISQYLGGSAIEITGGLFNTNKGIDAYVVENTDEATKTDYPYMAK